MVAHALVLILCPDRSRPCCSGCELPSRDHGKGNGSTRREGTHATILALLLSLLCNVNDLDSVVFIVIAVASCCGVFLKLNSVTRLLFS